MGIRFINRALLILVFACAFRNIALFAQLPGNVGTVYLASSNNVKTVYWSDSPYYGSVILQGAQSLSSTSTWSNLATDDQFVSLNSFPATGGNAQFITNRLGQYAAVSWTPTNQQQFFRLSQPSMIPACCFAIFYNGLLEFSKCPAMIINGRVHANGPIYMGTTASLTFNDSVTTTSNLSAPFVDGLSSGWTPSNSNTWNVFYNGNPGCLANTKGFNPADYHYMIEIPPAGENPLSFTGRTRLYNHAQLVLLVTNSPSGTNPAVRLTVQASIGGQVPGADFTPLSFYFTNASPGLLSSNLPFLSLTNRFYDQREYKTNLVTQVDMGILAIWIWTNQAVKSKLPPTSGSYPNILYVADQRNVTATQMPVVRLKNAAQLPYNPYGGTGIFGPFGFTVATLNPLYVWGNYNIQIDNSGNQSVATTNTTNTVPAALISDALTVLSSHWSDAVSFTSTYATGNASYSATDGTTINAAIITGTMPSTGFSATTYSGGVHNLPRLLEDWSSKILWLNTSIIRLWDSQMATNQFRNPAGFTPIPANPYYNPPTRRYSFDIHYLLPAYIPPGTPMLLSMP